MIQRTSLALLLGLFLIACGSKSNPAAPSTSQTPSPLTPQTVSLSGTVSALGGQRLSGATVTILDGANAGQSTATDGSGDYHFAALQRGNGNLAARANGYQEARKGVSIGNVSSLDFTLITEQPWSQSGTGANVFDVPSYITRVRVTGSYAGRCENFIVWVGSDLLVNEILGTCSIGIGPRYEGTHVTTGGVGRTESSSGISWTITEVR